MTKNTYIQRVPNEQLHNNKDYDFDSSLCVLGVKIFPLQ